MADGAYARAGVDLARTGRALAGLVDVLRGIDPGRPSATALGSGHYATVLRLEDRMGLALATDGVGTKLIVAEQLERFDSVGIDCVAMNVNDIVCVGADPIALLDYVAVEEADPDNLAAIARGLARGAEEAGVEIPGGELAVVPELLQGHPSPRGLDLVGFCIGLVQLDAIVTGERAEPGDAIVGLPSSGIHSNGLTLVRRVLDDLSETPGELDGRAVGDELLRPTTIYVRAVRELLASDIDVRGLAHITGDGFLNLLRLEAAVGWRIDSPLPVPPVFELIAERGAVDEPELYEVFNMGCGFCCIVPWNEAEAAVELLSQHHPGAAVIGQATIAAGLVELPRAASGRGLIGRRGEGFRAGG
jgi:phosphoribosylformylglycinamidine cyclo-ligase